MNDRWVMTQDDDGHWYMVRHEQLGAFRAYVENPYDETYPKGVVEIDGPHSIIIGTWEQP